MNHQEVLDSLTLPQKRALVACSKNDGHIYFGGHRFSSLDKLRKLGLLERMSDKVVASVYASLGEEHVQWRYPKGHWRHEWYLTPDGDDVKTLAVAEFAQSAEAGKVYIRRD